jgi:hypothetical protein
MEIYEVYRNDLTANLSFHLKELEWGEETEEIFFFSFPVQQEFCWCQGIIYHNEVGIV